MTRNTFKLHLIGLMALGMTAQGYGEKSDTGQAVGPAMKTALNVLLKTQCVGTNCQSPSQVCIATALAKLVKSFQDPGALRQHCIKLAAEKWVEKKFPKTGEIVLGEKGEFKGLKDEDKQAILSVLKHVSLPTLNVDEVDKLKLLPNLQYVDIRDFQNIAPEKPDMRGLMALLKQPPQGLKILKIQNLEVIPDQSLILAEALGKANPLPHLILNNLTFVDDDKAFFKNLLKNENLQKLELYNTTLTEAALQTITQSGTLKNLELDTFIFGLEPKAEKLLILQATQVPTKLKRGEDFVEYRPTQP